MNKIYQYCFDLVFMIYFKYDDNFTVGFRFIEVEVYLAEMKIDTNPKKTSEHW